MIRKFYDILLTDGGSKEPTGKEETAFTWTDETVLEFAKQFRFSSERISLKAFKQGRCFPYDTNKLKKEVAEIDSPEPERIEKEADIVKLGDDTLTELKKDPNHVTTQLNFNEQVSYNTGFHKGFLLGFIAGAKSEREEIAELREALKYLMEGVQGLPPLTAIEGTLIKHFEKAKKALNL